jgi:iron complex outermembrane receptor protein
VSAWSPKFSVGYEPGRWKFRYSVGKAYKFPLAEELFSGRFAPDMVLGVGRVLGIK